MSSRFQQQYKSTERYTLFGVLFGLLFPIVSTVLEIYFRQLPLTFTQFLTIQKSLPLLWVIDSAPLFLGIFAGFAGKRQDRLEILNDQLEAKVKERTKALRGALKKAEVAARVKSEFLANMSHEIRTPLNGCIGILQTIDTTGLKKEQLEDIETARSSGNSLLLLINDILDYSKLESQQIQLEKKSLLFTEYLQELLKPHQVLANQKGLKIISKTDPTLPPWLVLDPHRMGQILNNLLNNAIKFSRAGTIQLEAQNANPHLVITVKDQGIGIKKKAQKTIFNQFSQADNSTTREFGGTGLGLAICNQLASLMNATIELESEFGIGSCFKITLPLVLGSPEKQKTQPMIQAEHIIENPKILIVEDNPLNQKVIRKLLTQPGTELELADDGLIAVAKCKEQHFDLIFMDLQMPNLGGLEATQLIRKSHKNQNTPIIALTANVFQEDRQACLKVGMNDFLEKPVSMEKLYQCLIKHTSLNETVTKKKEEGRLQ